MKFIYNKLCAMQVITNLLELHKNYMKSNCAYLSIATIIRYLYLIDRRALIETGSTITGDIILNTLEGPILDKTKVILNDLDKFKCKKYF
jgi:hypothetical protein